MSPVLVSVLIVPSFPTPYPLKMPAEAPDIMPSFTRLVRDAFVMTLRPQASCVVLMALIVPELVSVPMDPES